MSKYDYSEVEKKINNVLAYQDKELKTIIPIDQESLEERISNTENRLQSLGYALPEKSDHKTERQKPVMIIPSWERLCSEAEAAVGSHCSLESIFTAEELEENSLAIRRLNDEFNSLHHLDKYDIAISAAAALLGAAVDILLVGMPEKTRTGLSAGKLENYIRAGFEKKYPAGALANSPKSKVPYDAQDNRNTTQNVEGLSAYYHRLLSLGHDPLLGFVVGVLDIMSGEMTTIDKAGKIIPQEMPVYADRKESNIFAALSKQVIHLKSDFTTSMGLPVPLMSLFNFLQFGSIGEEEQNIAEIVQGMYYEGYDFIHFCAMTIPVMITEAVVRLGYAFKRIKEGHEAKNSIPFSLDREKHPKLATMLFIAHTGAAAINAGKVLFAKDPMAINYPQWIAFAKYSFLQMKWVMIDKPYLQVDYVSGKLYEDYLSVIHDADEMFEDISKEYVILFD